MSVPLISLYETLQKIVLFCLYVIFSSILQFTSFLWHIQDLFLFIIIYKKVHFFANPLFSLPERKNQPIGRNGE